MSQWKPPAIPDISEKSVLSALKVIKEIIEMQEGMRANKDAVGFVKVQHQSDCPAGMNCVDQFNNVIIRSDVTVLNGEG